MSTEESSMPVKVGRNDPCHCGSGKKYKNCCMKKETSGMKGVTRVGMAVGKRLIADNVPIINSVIGAVDDLNAQKEKEELDARIAQIERTTSTTLDYVSDFSELLPILTQKPSLNKTYSLANILSSTIKDNPNYDIQIITNQNKNELRIIPKKTPIEVSLKLKMPIEKLEGLSSLEELIESKIKERESLIFTEEEIESFTFLDSEIASFLDTHPNFHELEFKPQIEPIPFDFSFVVENTQIAYHDVKMGRVYKNEKEATLVSTNLPFEILLRIRPDENKLNLKFHVELENTPILDLEKFWQFLSVLNDGNNLIIKDSKRETTIVKTSDIPNFVIDTEVANFISKLAMIDKAYYTNFTYPESVTIEDINVINNLVSIIKDKHLKINHVNLTVTSEEATKFIAIYEEKGFFENLFADIPVSYDLFGKSINVGEGRIFFEKAFIRENIDILKQEICKKEEIKMTFVSGNSDAKILF
ncbi:MAG: hypothetical protein PWQ50_836 [Methanolobus sp.]|nr:hypothetical protein [Methanolobus sp.]